MARAVPGGRGSLVLDWGTWTKHLSASVRGCAWLRRERKRYLCALGLRFLGIPFFRRKQSEFESSFAAALFLQVP